MLRRKIKSNRTRRWGGGHDGDVGRAARITTHHLAVDHASVRIFAVSAHRRGGEPAQNDSCLIDREAVASDDNGVAVFARLRRKPSGRHVFLIAFDLLELDGELALSVGPDDRLAQIR